MLIKLSILIALVSSPLFFFGQRKSVTLGYSNNGIVVGNSAKANGLRLNFWDRSVQYINGITVSGRSKSLKTNGLSVGLISNLDSINNGIKVGGLISTAATMNGICVGGLVSAASGKINGVAIAGLLCVADTMNGFFVSGIGATKLVNGEFSRVINGVAAGVVNDAITFNGLSVGFQNRTDSLSGLCVGLMINEAKSVRGMQVGISNRTKHLFGLQIGIWNVAENKRFLKRLPIINFSFRRMKQQDIESRKE